MRYLFTLLACAGVLCAALAAASPALAHRVNIFAYVEQSDIVVECSFSKSSKVNKGTLEVRDAVTGDLLTTATTDDKGQCRIPVPEKARKAGHGVTLRIIAGEGHQNDWTVEADELATATPASSAPAAQTSASGANAATASAVPATMSAGPSAAPASTTTSAAPTSAPAASAPTASTATAQNAPAPANTAAVQSPASPASAAATAATAPALTRADVESIVNRALDSRLAPITRMLAASMESGPTLRDIIGGLGWLFGLCGIAAYFRSRKS